MNSGSEQQRCGLKYCKMVNVAIKKTEWLIQRHFQHMGNLHSKVNGQQSQRDASIQVSSFTGVSGDRLQLQHLSLRTLHPMATRFAAAWLKLVVIHTEIVGCLLNLIFVWDRTWRDHSKRWNCLGYFWWSGIHCEAWAFSLRHINQTMFNFQIETAQSWSSPWMMVNFGGKPSISWPKAPPERCVGISWAQRDARRELMKRLVIRGWGWELFEATSSKKIGKSGYIQYTFQKYRSTWRLGLRLKARFDVQLRSGSRWMPAPRRVRRRRNGVRPFSCCPSNGWMNPPWEFPKEKWRWLHCNFQQVKYHLNTNLAKTSTSLNGDLFEWSLL